MIIVLRNQLKANRKEGFTLVEVIVVLVIIAVLAAIAVPALTGYIDKASDRALISESRNIHVAMQEILTEQYGNTGVAPTWTNATGATGINGSTANTTTNPAIAAEVSNLVGIDYTPRATDIANINSSGSAVKSFEYTMGGKTVKYDISGTPKYLVN
jgi:prepilin-type N-terminal cleavage/methylation domain-containing protein